MSKCSLNAVFSTLAPLTRFKVLTRTLTYKLRLAGNVVRALISDGYPLSAVVSSDYCSPNFASIIYVFIFVFINVPQSKKNKIDYRNNN